MKSPDKNQFEQNAHAFNRKLAIFVGADILLLVIATIAFVVVLTKSSDLSSQAQDVISAQEDEKKPNSNTTIEQDNQGLDIIQKDDDESGITDQDPPKTPATEKPNVDTPVISTPKPVTKPETKPGTTPSQTPTTPTKPTTTPSEPEVVTPPADVNNDFRKSLESKYGIKIAYGNELAGYKPKNKSTTPLTDVVQIRTQLNTLDSALAKYPAGFFAEPTETSAFDSLCESFAGGEGWIRTIVGVSQQIYSLPPLATRAPLRSEDPNYDPPSTRMSRINFQKSLKYVFSLIFEIYRHSPQSFTPITQSAFRLF